MNNAIRFSSRLLLPILATLILGACSEETTAPPDNDPGLLRLHFVPTFDGAPLDPLDAKVSAGGDTISMTAIRFYLSEFQLIDHDDAVTDVGGIYLVDLFEDSASQVIDFQVEPAHYHELQFSVGVPESENHKDAATQSEPLGPNSGMYWGWDPGYIFYKIEGRVDSAGTQIPFLYHGGEDSRRKRIELMGHDHMNILAGQTRTVTIEVAMEHFFEKGLDPSGPLRLRDNVTARTHHKNPADVADMTARNLATTFAIESSE